MNLWQQAWFVDSVSTLGSALIAFVLFRLTVWINKKTKSEKMNYFTNLALDVISTSVKFTYQNFVEQLKKDGDFDAEAQEEALKMSIDRALSLLSANAIEFLTGEISNFDDWVRNQVESTVLEQLPHSEQ